MPVNNYVVVGVLFGLPAAIFFHFWPDHIYAGLGFITLGFLVFAFGIPLRNFDRTIKYSSAGLLLVAIGASILPVNAWAWASLLIAGAASQLAMANFLEKRLYDLRERIFAVVGVAFPVLALLLVRQVADQPTVWYLVLSFVLILFFGALGHWMAPDASSGLQRYAEQSV